jgi:hypothetical protein
VKRDNSLLLLVVVSLVSKRLLQLLLFVAFKEDAAKA